MKRPRKGSAESVNKRLRLRKEKDGLDELEIVRENQTGDEEFCVPIKEESPELESFLTATPNPTPKQAAGPAPKTWFTPVLWPKFITPFPPQRNRRRPHSPSVVVPSRQQHAGTHTVYSGNAIEESSPPAMAPEPQTISDSEDYISETPQPEPSSNDEVEESIPNTQITPRGKLRAQTSGSRTTRGTRKRNTETPQPEPSTSDEVEESTPNTQITPRAKLRAQMSGPRTTRSARNRNTETSASDEVESTPNAQKTPGRIQAQTSEPRTRKSARNRNTETRSATPAIDATAQSSPKKRTRREDVKHTKVMRKMFPGGQKKAQKSEDPTREVFGERPTDPIRLAGKHPINDGKDVIPTVDSDEDHRAAIVNSTEASDPTTPDAEEVPVEIRKQPPSSHELEQRIQEEVAANSVPWNATSWGFGSAQRPSHPTEEAQTSHARSRSVSNPEVVPNTYPESEGDDTKAESASNSNSSRSSPDTPQRPARLLSRSPQPEESNNESDSDSDTSQPFASADEGFKREESIDSSSDSTEDEDEDEDTSTPKATDLASPVAGAQGTESEDLIDISSDEEAEDKAKGNMKSSMTIDVPPSVGRTQDLKNRASAFTGSNKAAKKTNDKITSTPTTNKILASAVHAQPPSSAPVSAQPLSLSQPVARGTPRNTQTFSRPSTQPKPSRKSYAIYPTIKEQIAAAKAAAAAAAGKSQKAQKALQSPDNVKERLARQIEDVFGAGDSSDSDSDSRSSSDDEDEELEKKKVGNSRVV
ncbi:hypothetical protein P280DRAFT_227742 [Massarina eburnea CBS 473.64]|uniref:Uncharacterized protein n=1 Tax=Massarina eburnea CBS 473.64 TaxID=1395130 RepID=A0A6A6S938_9PLEO|nr:hypothetical protein P280DRAFT_227742 [Massarina eburnea CBS 473.64]